MMEAAQFLAIISLTAISGIAIGSLLGRWVAVRRAEKSGLKLEGNLFEKYREIVRLERELP